MSPISLCKRFTFLVYILILAVILQGLGCSRTELLRPYLEWENDEFKGIEVPSSNDILEKAKYTKVFPRPLDQVWEVCLDFAIQGGGILGLKVDPDDTYRLLFVGREPGTYQSFQSQKVMGRIPPFFKEAWIAVNVRRIQDDKTQVAIAWISPMSGQAANPHEEVSGYRGSDLPIDEYSRVALAAMDNYLGALELQLSSKNPYEHLFSPPLVRGPLRGEPPKISESPLWGEYSRPYGNFKSAEKRTTYYVIENDLLARHVKEILKRLKAAAGPDVNEEFGFYIISSNNKNAYATSNGDLFITTGLLKELKDGNELAAVLAHEVDHILQSDPITRLEDEIWWANATAISTATGVLVGYAAVLAAVLIFVPGAEVFTAPKDLTLIKGLRNLGFAALTISGMVGAGFFGHYLILEGGEFGVRDYSKDQELRADRNGAKYLWRAGYPSDALLKVLKRRQEQKRILGDGD